MKKFSLALTILTAVSFAAQAQTVGSANVMGYTKITIPSNEYAFVALNFETTNNTINDLFGDLPNSSKIILWNTSIQDYDPAIQKGRSGWGAAGTNQIKIGQGVFVLLPPDVEETVLFSGDVLNTGTTTVYSVNGYSPLAFPYSSETYFTNTALAKTAANSDKVSFWVNNDWVSYQKGRSGWDVDVSSVKIKLGEGFFYETSTGKGVDEVRPYSLD